MTNREFFPVTFLTQPILCYQHPWAKWLPLIIDPVLTRDFRERNTPTWEAAIINQRTWPFASPPAVPVQHYDNTHMWESTSTPCFPPLLVIPPPFLFFHSHFIFSALVLFQCLAAHPVPALTFIFLGIPLLSKEHTCTPFQRLSGHLSRIISYPEGPGLPHLPRMNNRIQPEYFIYYLQTQVK